MRGQSACTQDREARGKRPLLSPLWQDDRTEATNRKQPQCSFAQWSAAWAALREQAEHMRTGASMTELIERVRRDDSLLARLVEVALRDPQMVASVAELVERVDPDVRGLRSKVVLAGERLAALLLEVALSDDTWMQSVVDQAAEDENLFARVLSIASRHEPAVSSQLTEMGREREQRQAALLALIIGIARSDATLVTVAVRAALSSQTAAEVLMKAICEEWPHLGERMEDLRQSGNSAALLRVVSFAAERSDAVLSVAMNAAMRDQEARARLLERLGSKNEEVSQLTEELLQDQEGMLGLVAAVAQTYPAAGREILSIMHFQDATLASSLVDLAQYDMRSLITLLPGVADSEAAIRQFIVANERRGARDC